MPAISIDTFFACVLMVTVIVTAMAVTAKIVQPYISNIEELNQAGYLEEIAQKILLTPGNPVNWGVNGTLTPEVFGLAKNGSIIPYELDIDKVCRLNPANSYSLDYSSILQSLKVGKVALRISVTQLSEISVTPIANQSIGNAVNYTFRMRVERNGIPAVASLNCYVIARNFMDRVSAETSSSGEATVSFIIPNNSSGAALFVVFARNIQEPRVTSYAAYTFGHLSEQSTANNMFAELSPLNYTLYINKFYETETLLEVYALTYSQNKSLTETVNSAYRIPKIIDKSPIVLVVTGTNQSTFFIEYTAYPQVPLETGANMQNAEAPCFYYIVSINQVFYKVRVQCEGPSG